MTDIHTDYPPEITGLTDDELVQYINEHIEHLHTNHNLPTMHVQNRNRHKHDTDTALNYFRHRLEYERQHAEEVRDMMVDEREEMKRDRDIGRDLLIQTQVEKNRLQEQYNQHLERLQRRHADEINNLQQEIARRVVERDNLQARVDRLTRVRDNTRIQLNNAINQYNLVYNQLGESNNRIVILTGTRDRLQRRIIILRFQVAWFRNRAVPQVPPPPVRPPQVIWIPRS